MKAHIKAVNQRNKKATVRNRGQRIGGEGEFS